MEEVKTEAGAVPDANAVSEGGAEPDAVPTADTVADVEVTATSSTSAGGGPEPKSVPAELPFQLQIRYTDTEGMKALRVLTQTKPVTHDRDLAEKSRCLCLEVYFRNSFMYLLMYMSNVMTRL